MTILVLVILLIAFALMVRGVLTQEVAFPAVAMIFMILAPHDEGANALQDGGAEFVRIALIFTSVAVPAHLLARSNALRWMCLLMGEWIGRASRLTRLPFWVLVPTVCLVSVYVSALLFHNTTSILVFAPLIILISELYKVRAKPILCGALIASNLGGFSSRWGDTPNIIEAKVWLLSHRDFFLEILPINLGFLVILCVIVGAWIRWGLTTEALSQLEKFDIFYAEIRFRGARRQLVIDKRSLGVGIVGLMLAVGSSIFFSQHEIIAAAGALTFCALSDRREQREHTLQALGIETYFVLFSVFVMAQILAHSSIGVASYLEAWLSGGSLISIITASYFGTMMSEAASWAAAAAPIVHAQLPTHAAAWALGGGICAGSSSVVTAATAGILLSRLTSSYSPDVRISFGSYFFFGIGASALMLLYYSLVLWIVW